MRKGGASDQPKSAAEPKPAAPDSGVARVVCTLLTAAAAIPVQHKHPRVPSVPTSQFKRHILNYPSMSRLSRVCADAPDPGIAVHQRTGHLRLRPPAGHQTAAEVLIAVARHGRLTASSWSIGQQQKK